MITNVLVSVVIPNYNNDKYLKEAIDSVLNQTYSNIEIIVVDDCSSDSSRSLIETLSKFDTRVKFHFNSKNLGVSASRNIGISLAVGDYITTLDSDDVYFSDKIEKELNAILSSKHRNRDVVAFSNVCIVDENLRHIRKVMHKFTLHEGDIFKKMLYRSVPFGRDVMVSKEVINKVGLFNEERCLYEDWEHKLKLAKACDFVFSGSKGIMYRQLKSGLSSVDSSNHKEAMESIFTSFAPNGNIRIFRLLNGRSLFTRVIKRIFHLRFVNDFFL